MGKILSRSEESICGHLATYRCILRNSEYRRDNLTDGNFATRFTEPIID
jgi:hypothetical protein